MNQVVQDALAERLAECGRLTYAEFMEIALYHPTHGYYNRPEMTIGERGDFYTSPMVHPIFGMCIARQLYEMWDLLGRPSPFFVLEMGAGVGTLAVDFLREAMRMPVYYEAIEYHIVEQGAVLREKQKANAAEQGVVDKITWHETLGEVLEQYGQQTGVIFSNELFDALPVHLLGKVDDGYVEYYLEGDDEARGYREVQGTLSNPQLVSLLDEETQVRLTAGDRLEVCPGAGEVIEAMGGLLERGFVLTIDYGDLAPDVHFRHTKGLRSYYKQRAAEPLDRVGDQDLTTDVDFSLLIRRGEQAGLEWVGYTKQKYLLGGNGFLYKVQELQNRSAKLDLNADFELQRMLKLFMPQMLGDVFKVLFQAKGMDVERAQQRLSALNFSLEG